MVKQTVSLGDPIEAIILISYWAGEPDEVYLAAATRDELGELPADLQDAPMAGDNHTYRYRTLTSKIIKTLANRGYRAYQLGSGCIILENADGKRAAVGSKDWDGNIRNYTWREAERLYLVAYGMLQGWSDCNTGGF